ncbi:MAG TPA: bacillithiol system redox-active protein YtxJ [Saprospiraceae bacterium]|nr:bacillithiol system redox-active protein YtxJ [Saprospiraceae bacterium]
MDWKSLTSFDDIETINKESFDAPVVILKHSRTCSISAMAKMRLEDKWDLELDAYYLDILSYRNLSNALAEKYQVHHESPQLLLIKNGECTYDASHFDISVAELKESLTYNQEL